MPSLLPPPLLLLLLLLLLSCSTRMALAASSCSSTTTASVVVVSPCVGQRCVWNQTDFASFCTAHCNLQLCASASSHGHVACSYNDHLPSTYAIPASNITNLEIDANNFPALGPSLLVNNPQLLELWAYGNNIRSVSPALIQSIPLVQRLDFGNNQLETLDNGTFANTTMLSNLWLYGNPWQCDCRLQWLQEWINEPSNLGVLYEGDNTLCVGPPHMHGFTIGNASLPICCAEVPCADGEFNGAICNSTVRNLRQCQRCPDNLVGLGGLCNTVCTSGTQPNQQHTVCVPCPAPYVGVDGVCNIACSSSDARNSELTDCIAANTSVPKWLAPTVAFILIAFFAALGIIYYLYRKRRSRFQQDIALHEKLLEDSQTEIADLTRAWQIAHEDLHFVQRIDTDMPGAFGEVWLARWADREVAVKKLRKIAIAYADRAMSEFEREVKVLRTLRHPHIVLFFGAGADSEGE